MVTRAKSIPELPNLAVPATDDLLVVVDVSLSNTTKKTTVGAVAGVIASANLTMTDSAVFSANTLITRNVLSPANSTSISVQRGTIFFDANYLYVATGNNFVKRVLLSEF